MSSAKHSLGYFMSIAGDTVMESIVFVFEFCKEKLHKPCVVA